MLSKTKCPNKDILEESDERRSKIFRNYKEVIVLLKFGVKN